MNIKITVETPNVTVDSVYAVTGGQFTSFVGCKNAECSESRVTYTVVGNDETPARVPVENAIEV